jgi:hypothetical protein
VKRNQSGEETYLFNIAQRIYFLFFIEQEFEEKHKKGK